LADSLYTTCWVYRDFLIKKQHRWFFIFHNENLMRFSIISKKQNLFLYEIRAIQEIMVPVLSKVQIT